jgi:hypothetical protein
MMISTLLHSIRLFLALPTMHWPCFRDDSSRFAYQIGGMTSIGELSRRLIFLLRSNTLSAYATPVPARGTLFGW